MTGNDLIGKVAACYLRNLIPEDDASGTARYLLDCLTAEQTASVARAILDDTAVCEHIEIKLPQNFVGDFGLPDEILTKERTTYYRNASCEKPLLLVANTGDDEEQSLKELVPIGAQELQSRPEMWIDIASEGLSLPAQHKIWWIKAIQGLLEVRSFALDRFSEYILKTREAILTEGQPIRDALGMALPALQVPKDTSFFSSLNDKTANYLSKWKGLFSQAIKKRACYLKKQTPTQALLLEEDLVVSFDKVKDAIPEALHSLIIDFILSPAGWNQESSKIAQCEWDLIRPLFDGLKREKLNLGKATIEFYDEREPELLTDEERDYLDRLSNSKRNDAQEEDEEFYRQHRDELKDQPSLKAKWDRFVFGTPFETDDFLLGIAMCMERLFDQNMPSSKRKLRISCDRRTKKDLRELNEDAGLYFSRRYRGLKELFGNKVTWDVGELMNFSMLSDQWRNANKRHVNTSQSKSALQLKFTVELEVTLQDNTPLNYNRQLFWTFNSNGIACEFSADWARLSEHPMVYSRVNREPVSSKGRFQSLDIRNVSTLYPVFGKERGSFVSTFKKVNDISHVWKQNLDEAVRQNRITNDTASSLNTLFVEFCESYKNAIKGFIEDGLSCEWMLKQVEDYKDILLSICKSAKGDRNRQELLRPLLQIGAVSVDGGTVATIITPWHPLRMAAISNKANQVSSLIRHLLSTDDVFFGDAPLFFKELQKELSHPYYPEIVIGWNENKPEILSLTDAYLDYSLHESPIINNDGYDETNESPSETCALVNDLTKRFLVLYPHERANLTIVLYNCDSARLPYALVDKMNEMNEDDEDMRCQIILRHRDGQKLRELYENIVESSDNDADSFVSSEASKDFMARLRIGIMADQAPIPDPKDGPPADIVFLQDVIARHSRLEWYEESNIPVDSMSFIPALWSRRRPAAIDDMKSVIYLCCPVQSPETMAFMTALTTFFKGDWNEAENKCLLPARQLDFNDPLTSSIFKEVHNLGVWVVNYDELLDRRQLVNQGVQVIRYKQGAAHSRNILISSTAPLSLLKTMVFSRVKALNLELDDSQCRELTTKFINDANEISGDIVLRAAKRGRNASELMGVVLSRHLIRQELGTDRYYGWYFLDDYAEWLGQREEQIADILVLSPESTNDGKYRLAVVVSEAKYIDIAGLSAKRKESQKQLRDTMRRISDAVFGDPKRLDRDLWLSRFSDLMLNGIQFPANATIDLSTWRRAVREGNCEIYLRGYSHVFVSGPSDSEECSDFTAVAETDHSYQEVFSREKLRELVMSYWLNSDPLAIRKAVADEDIWQSQTYRKPSEKIPFIVPRKKKVSTDKDEPSENGDSTVPPPPPDPLPKPPVPKTKKPAKEPEVFSNNDEVPKWTNEKISHLLDVTSDETKDSASDLDWLKQVESMCKSALQHFQLQSKLSSSILTPNAALLKFQGSANLTVDQVLKKRSEFLTTHKLNVISVRGEPGVVVIAIARPNRRVLHLREVWKQWMPESVNGNCVLLLAVKEENSEPLYLSPKANAPHTLIAGSTGSGKSILIQNIILAIACTNTPEQAKILIIDPKLGVDYFAFEGLPHLQGGIIDDQDNAVERLSQLTEEMDRRYKVLRENKVANIFELNKKEGIIERLPFLWIIHDEFAEWMMTSDYADHISSIVGRLGAKARAAGIFLVFAAQRPDAGVMPMQLRANLGNRLVLRVDSEGTSEIALGEKGAERLLGKGHLAARLEGEPQIVFAQVPFIEPSLIEEIVKLLK